MSRVDQALTAWEARRVTTTTPDSQSVTDGRAVALHEYTEERRPSPKHSPPSVASQAPQPPPIQTTPASAEPQPLAGRKSQRAADIEARLVTNPSNAVSIEQYRRLAAVLHEVQAGKPLKTVMITSAVPQEGKTLTVVNLGLTLSESYGRRVLLIDADLRSPSLHLTLGMPNSRGLCDAFRDPGDDLPFVRMSDRLSVLTAGRPDGMPLAALSSPRTREVVTNCAGQFDWVLIDTSPIGILPDASVLTRLVDGVIFVIRAGTTPSPVVERAIGEIDPQSIIGVVLNNLDERRIGAAGYYHDYEAAHAKR